MRLICLLIAACLGLGALSPSVAEAARPELSQTDNEARKKALAYFKQGRTAYKAGDYDAALKFFRQAQATYEHEVLIILALAKTFDKGGEHERARKYYKLFLKESEPSDKARPATVKRIAELDKLLAARPGILVFRNLPSSAVVKIDGKDRPVDARGAVKVAAGTYAVRVEMENHLPFVREGVVIGAGETRHIPVVLQKPVDPSTLPRDHFWTWTLGTTASVTALAGATFWLLSISASNDYHELFTVDEARDKAVLKSSVAAKCKDLPDACASEMEKGRQLKEDFSTYQTAAGVLALTAAGLAVGTGIAYFAAPVDREAIKAQTHWQVTPQVSPTFTGAALTLRF